MPPFVLKSTWVLLLLFLFYLYRYCFLFFSFVIFCLSNNKLIFIVTTISACLQKQQKRDLLNISRRKLLVSFLKNWQFKKYISTLLSKFRYIIKLSHCHEPSPNPDVTRRIRHRKVWYKPHSISSHKNIGNSEEFKTFYPNNLKPLFKTTEV